MRLMNGDEVIYHAEGRNQATISNFKIYPTNEEDSTKDYKLVAYFHAETWPEALTENEQTKGICWQLTINGTDNIAFLKDTRKEQKYQKIVNSWEEKDEGRKEKAK